MKFLITTLVSIIIAFLSCDYLLGLVLYPFKVDKTSQQFTPNSIQYPFKPGFSSYLNNPNQFQKSFNIIMLGDSFIQGNDLPDEETIPNLLEDKLSEIKNEVRVHNAGLKAANSVDYYFALKHILSRVTPDLVIVSHTSNDFIFKEYNLDKYLVCAQLSSTSKGLLYTLSRWSNIFYYFYSRKPLSKYEFQQENTCSLEYITKIQNCS